MPATKMRNISTTYQEKYQTEDGNVTVTNFKRGLWQVMPRGHMPFLVGSKREAFEQAIGIATRHWGLPKEQAFPRRGRRQHAAKKAGLSADQRAEIDASLAAYGARLTDDDRIAKGDKVMSVQIEAKGGRIKMVGGGNVLASYPAARAGQGISDFVEKFWFWKKDASASGPGHAHARKKSPAQLDREIRESLAGRSHAVGNPYDVKIDDAVQFLWEPQTGGVVRRLLPDREEGRQWVEVATSRGPRKVPIDALRRVRPEHESRVRRSVEKQ